MARWAYLFIAIDPYTYDLLHIEIYPTRNTGCAKAFLLGLKAQGVLTPTVIVTDLWQPYEKAIPDVYPGTVHHQCVFHAEQACSDLMRDKLGRDFRKTPEAKQLMTEIISLFRSGSRRTLRRRYARLLERKDLLVARCPDLAPVFEYVGPTFRKDLQRLLGQTRGDPLEADRKSVV